jgi:hypothetical protein
VEAEIPKFSIRPYKFIEDRGSIYLDAMETLSQGDQYPSGDVSDILLLIRSKCLIAVGEDNALMGFIIYVREEGEQVCKILRVGVMGIDFETLEVERIANFIVWELIQYMQNNNPGATLKVVCSLSNIAIGDLLRSLCFTLMKIIPRPGDAVAGLYVQMT